MLTIINAAIANDQKILSKYIGTDMQRLMVLSVIRVSKVATLEAIGKEIAASITEGSGTSNDQKDWLSRANIYPGEVWFGCRDVNMLNYARAHVANFAKIVSENASSCNSVANLEWLHKYYDIRTISNPGHHAALFGNTCALDWFVTHGITPFAIWAKNATITRLPGSITTLTWLADKGYRFPLDMANAEDVSEKAIDWFHNNPEYISIPANN